MSLSLLICKMGITTLILKGRYEDHIRLWTRLFQAEILQVWETSEATEELDKCEASWAPRQRAIPAMSQGAQGYVFLASFIF